MAKATAACTCKTCGCAFEKTAYKAKRSEANSWEEWAVSYYDECDSCRDARIAEERKQQSVKDAAESAEAGFPELTGTEKQVAWAVTLRMQFVNDCNKAIGMLIEDRSERQPGDEHIEKLDRKISHMQRDLDYAIRNFTDAKFWIDSREFTCRYVLKSALEAEKAEAPEVKEPVESDHKLLNPSDSDVVANVEIESEVKLDSVVEKITVVSPKNEVVIKTVKESGYTWNSGKWSKRITEFTGCASDRAAEIANTLLNAGIAVRIRSDLADMAVNATYEPEKRRWVKFSENSNSFVLKWPDKDDMFSVAQKIPGAHWKTGHGMMVPVTRYKEVADFADLYGFGISKFAMGKIKQADAEVISVKPEKKVVTDPGKLQSILDSKADVLADLIDD